MLSFKPNSLSWVELIINKLNKNKVLNLTNISTVLFGSIILIISAKIKVDFYPVPMTLQPLAVLMIGMLYGRNLATATIGLYIMEGVVGLPVFALGGGFFYLFGPTGGFIFGFFIAGLVLGILADRGWGKDILSAIFCMILGMFIIYFFGILQLSLTMGLKPAIIAMYLYLIGDAIKIILAAILVPFIWRLAK